ncbi:hypothetical protein PMAYCL1PPCAC_20995, partial [Pristionchus mayeri]
PEFTEERYDRLKEVLTSCKEVSLQVGGTVGEDLISCIKSLGRLSERLKADWQGVWHNGSAASLQQKRTKIVCSSMNEALLITLELIDHKTGGRLKNLGMPQSETLSKPVKRESSASPELIPTPSSSAVVNDESKKRCPQIFGVEKLIGSTPCSDGAIDNLTVDRPVHFEASDVSSISEKKKQQIQKRDILVPGMKSDNDAIRHLHQVAYSQVLVTREYAKRADESEKKLDRIIIEKAALSVKLNDALRFIGDLSRRVDELQRTETFEKMMLNNKLDDAVAIIKDIAAQNSFQQLPNRIRSRMINFVVEHFRKSKQPVPVRSNSELFKDGLSTIGSGQSIFPSIAKWHPAQSLLAQNVAAGGGVPALVPLGDNRTESTAFQGNQALASAGVQLTAYQPPSADNLIGSEGTHFVCFVCGVFVTDSSLTVNGPAIFHAMLSGFNPQQMLQLRAATNLGGKGLPVVCKSHSQQEILRIVQQNMMGVPDAAAQELPQHQSSVDRKRSYEDLFLIPDTSSDSGQEESTVGQNYANWPMKTVKEIKVEIKEEEGPEPKKVKVEEDD